MKRQHAAGPLRVLAIRPSPAAAWADSLPENRLHGVVAGKLYTYASDARVRRWPNGIEITGKRNTSMTETAVSAALGLIRYAKRIDDPSARPPPPNSLPPDSNADDLESVPG